MKLRISILASLSVLSTSLLWAEYSSPDWYELRMKRGSTMVVKITGEKGSSYSCLYQGLPLDLPKANIKSVHSIWEAKTFLGKPHNLEEEDCRKVLDSIEDLNNPDHNIRKKALKFLGDKFPDSRPFVHYATIHTQRRVRMLSVRLLGEKGELELDQKVVLKRLQDEKPKVRLMALLATRKLGRGGVDQILKYLETETVVNNKKMAVKALHYWKVEEAVEPLIHLLVIEKDKGVRKFIHHALVYITGNKSIKDPSGWTLRYIEKINKNTQSHTITEHFPGGDSK